MAWNIDIDVELDNSTLEKIQNNIDKVVESVARQTLELSYNTIPLKGGELRLSSKSYGVRKVGKASYQIGSRTVYAAYQYAGKRKDGSHVVRNYTTPGTNKEWYTSYYKIHGKSILANAIEENKLK